MDISSDKQTKPLTRKLGHGYEKKNLKRETEFLHIATYNNAIQTNCIKAKLDKNNKIANVVYNPIISECSKLAQKQFKTRHDCLGKMILMEL